MTYVREESVENYLVRRVKALGGDCYKWVSPGLQGVPDRICVFDGGRVFFVETKAPKGSRMQPAQPRRHRDLRNRGFRVYVPKTRAEVDELLRNEGL